ncbi:MAG TPA: hypothetical protein VF179_28000 [Thermoanaerobaculia bacterium]|nr:hypothetical protein [Thermoanaerobaculia bacterium]
MSLLASPSAALLAAAVVVSSCATADLAEKQAQVRIFNLYRRGVITPLPRTLEGCEPLGPVVATPPEYANQNPGPFDPEQLLPALRARAARKSADTLLVSFEPHSSSLYEPRILRGTTFRCGTHPLPPELGEPLK